MGADNFLGKEVSGKRAAKRARVLLAATLETPAGEFKARLRDLSALGALVECVEAIPVGTDLLFVRGGTTVRASVAWSAVGKLGLKFLEPIDEQEVMKEVAPRRPAARRTLTEAPATQPNLPAAGAEIVIFHGSVALPGRVAWVRDGRLAIDVVKPPAPPPAADAPVSASRRIEPKGGRLRRPPVSGLTREEKRLAKAWGTTVGIALPEAED